MIRLASLLFAFVGPTMAGIFMIIALVSGYDTLKYVAGSAALGALLALPTVYFVAKAIKDNEAEA